MMKEGKENRIKESIISGSTKEEEEGKEPNKDKNADTEEGHGDRKVVNIIPLPPRKPTNYTAVGSQSSPSVTHRSVLTEEKKVGGRPQGSQGNSAAQPTVPDKNMSLGQKASPHTNKAQNVSSSSPKHASASSKNTSPSKKNTSPSNKTTSPAHKNTSPSHDLTKDITGRVRRISDDRPKLDKSHSTPAYDMDGDETQLTGIQTPARKIEAPDRSGTPSTGKGSSSSVGTFEKMIMPSDRTETTRVEVGTPSGRIASPSPCGSVSSLLSISHEKSPSIRHRSSGSAEVIGTKATLG